MLKKRKERLEVINISRPDIFGDHPYEQERHSLSFLINNADDMEILEANFLMEV